MAEVTQYSFSHKELLEILIRDRSLHEGIWAIAFQLGLGVGNVPPPAGGDPVPAAIVSIVSVGLQKAPQEGPTALDAAKVNPAKK